LYRVLDQNFISAEKVEVLKAETTDLSRKAGGFIFYL